jgi:hypothetical protein
MSVWHPLCIKGRERERTMKQDLISLTGVTLALAVTGWFFWGNPQKTAHAVQAVPHDPDVMFVSERSLYMRDER